MAIKNIISKNGFRYEIIPDPTDGKVKIEIGQLTITGVQLTEPLLYKVYSDLPDIFIINKKSFTKNTVFITYPFTILSASLTASLLKISDNDVGKQFILAFTGTNGNILISGSDPINNGLWTRTISNKNIIWCFAVKTPVSTFNWIIASGSAV